MGRNKKIKARIAGLEQAIAVHQKKIETEQAEPIANTKRINHWHSEIEGWTKQIERLTRRLRPR